MFLAGAIKAHGLGEGLSLFITVRLSMEAAQTLEVVLHMASTGALAARNLALIARTPPPLPPVF